MAEGKYGRLFTEADVERIALRISAFAVPSPEVVIGRLDAEGALTFPADEPLFLLRGQDALTPDVVREYAIRVDDPSAVNEAHRRGAWAAADGIREWQAQNPDRVKVPD